MAIVTIVVIHDGGGHKGCPHEFVGEGPLPSDLPSDEVRLADVCARCGAYVLVLHEEQVELVVRRVRDRYGRNGGTVSVERAE